MMSAVAKVYGSIPAQGWEFLDSAYDERDVVTPLWQAAAEEYQELLADLESAGEMYHYCSEGQKFVDGSGYNTGTIERQQRVYKFHLKLEEGIRERLSRLQRDTIKPEIRVKIEAILWQGVSAYERAEYAMGAGQALVIKTPTSGALIGIVEPYLGVTCTLSHARFAAACQFLAALPANANCVDVEREGMSELQKSIAYHVSSGEALTMLKSTVGRAKAHRKLDEFDHHGYRIPDSDPSRS